jgi:hypothetical protein
MHFSGGGGGVSTGGKHHYVDKPNRKGKYWPPTGTRCPLDPTMAAGTR